MGDGRPNPVGPLVSVIVPVHNGRLYVSESIGSVLGQTYPHIECIVVDDGSVDGTGALLSTLGARVTTVCQERRGAAAARNAGAAKGKGAFLCFLDADDLWMPEKVATQVEVMMRVPECGLAYTGYWVSRNGSRSMSAVLATDPLTRLREALLLEGPGLASSTTAMVTRDAFDAVGGYDETLFAGEDIDLVSRIARRYPVVSISAPLAVYRRHAAQSHRYLERLERDMGIVVHRALSHGLAVSPQRARANLNSFLAWRYLLSGRWREAKTHLNSAWRNKPSSLLVLPIRAGQRRLVAALLKRWPVREPRAICVRSPAEEVNEASAL